MVESFGSLFAKEFGKRNNPTDMKSGIIGKVVQVEPVIVSIDNGKVLLKENNELEISEWFRFRCKLGKNASDTSMQSTVKNALYDTYPQSVSCNATVCNTSDAIGNLYVAVKPRIQRYEYDVLTEKYTVLELGTIKPTLPKTLFAVLKKTGVKI